MSFTNVFDVAFSKFEIHSFTSEILKNKFNKKIIVTPNVDHIVRLNKDANFRDIYLAADIFVNDSRILKFLSKLIRKPINSLIPGSDLTAFLFDKIATEYKGVKVAVIGGEESVITKIKAKYQIHNIPHYNPPMGFHTDEAELQKCIDLCKSADADIIFLAVGSPKQEIVAARLRNENVNGCYLCIGASLLFLAGEEKRAPLFIQKIHCEWLFRLLQSPRRLAKRYLVDGLRIIPICIKEYFR
ncbi:hypothetical protein PULV_a3880 [Pseudoalteromonas ulvae UL12]|uniref:WecB/TagA/CpsF family glycosyltransferase n=1 Tax=Pseudoalteromonas ulvae TaxID=107327 RepID=UPI00186B9C4B|nr:WecB/TagA/CpsF family glycosyltransferase [Pseudoalteromonas ulvae]MBE0363254.1 hypothetical protein [Pseudoalteromonas ulvae UL12]